MAKPEPLPSSVCQSDKNSEATVDPESAKTPAPSGSGPLDRLIKCGQLVSFAAGLCYFFGILIVNFYYAKYHFVTFELFRIKYVFAGLWFCLFMGVFTYLIWLVSRKANDLNTQTIAKMKGKESNIKILIIQICFWVGMVSFVIFVLSTVLAHFLVTKPNEITSINIKITNRLVFMGVVGFVVSLLYIISGTDWSRRHPLLFYVALGVSCIGLFIVLSPLLGQYLGSFWLFLFFLVASKDIRGLINKPNFINNILEEKYAKDVLLSLFWLSVTLGLFSTTIYCNIKPELGGGHPITAKVTGDADFLTRLNQSGVVLKPDSAGVVVHILDRSNSEFFFLAGNQAIAVPINEVKLIQYLSLTPDTAKSTKQ